MKKSAYSIAVMLCVYGVLCNSCTSYKTDPKQVVLHTLADPDMMNPVNSTDASAQEIEGNIFQPLVAYDMRTLKLVPVLADSLPIVVIDSLGRMDITFEIRKEAKWDNGTPITAKDVAFTFKAIKDPAVNDEPIKPYFDFVNDIIYLKTYSENPRKFTIVCAKKYILAVTAAGGALIIPEYLYDPNKYLEHMTLQQMHDDKNLATDSNMIAFAKDFNSDKFARDPKYVSGSGPYRFTQWITGQRVVLERKKDWWGDALPGINCYFDADATKLIYQVVNDQTTALVSLKAGNLDVMNDIRPEDFVELPKSQKFTDNFNTFTPTILGYSYLGINTAEPKLAGVKTRQALAHLCDIPRMIKDVIYGYAEQVIGPVPPSDSMDYDYSIKPYAYDLDSAKALLAEDGWKDSDGDGILDKTIDGQKTDLVIRFLVNSGNDSRKKIALIFQEAARKVGVTVNIIQQEWNVYLDNVKKHDFDMYYGAWSMPYGAQDFKQIFYTTSALNGGSNAVSFGNAESDALIDSIRVELNDTKRAVMVKRLEGIMHQQCAYIFLWSPKALVAVNKRFTNVYSSPLYPYYWEAGFKAKAAE